MPGLLSTPKMPHSSLQHTRSYRTLSYELIPHFMVICNKASALRVLGFAKNCEFVACGRLEKSFRGKKNK